ncbi:MAG TPA: P1 family peptidase [Bacillota bacterium]
MITQVPGIRVGHATDAGALTGCTVVLPDEPAVAGVDVRGGAPGTRETDLLRPGRLVERVHAILLTGGSAFGLEAAAGVMRWLEERGIGFATGYAPVPIVPAAVLYDLGIGRADRRPDAAMGYEACRAATAGPVAEGNIGAGTGATVGKALGMAGAMRGGIGSYSQRLASGVIVGALVAVNCLGDVYDPDSGERLAGARDPSSGAPVDGAQLLRDRDAPPPGLNTTLAVVAVDAIFDKAEATRVAEIAHDGFARAIRPVHTQFDGDVIFVLATGRRRADVSAVGAAAADVVARAIVRAIKAAHSAAGIPAWRDLEQR